MQNRPSPCTRLMAPDGHKLDFDWTLRVRARWSSELRQIRLRRVTVRMPFSKPVYGKGHPTGEIPRTQERGSRRHERLR